MGIALASDAPVFSGIIAGIVGGVVVGVISKSSLSVSGPAAGLTTIVATAIAQLPSFEAFLLTVVIAGFFQIVLGLVKAGVLGDFVPSSVIKGMLAAIGLTLIINQLPHLIGHDDEYKGIEQLVHSNPTTLLSKLIEIIDYSAPGALVIGIFALSIMVLWEVNRVRQMRWTRWFPAPLVVVVGGVVINEFFGLAGSALHLDPDHLVRMPVPEHFDEFILQFRTPDFELLSSSAIWMLGFTIAMVASLESLLGIEAVDKLDPKKRVSPPNRELIAQGAGNMVSGLIGGLPVTSVVVRSSANVTAGAESKASTILHGSWLLLSVALIPAVLNRIPLSALAAVLLYVGYKLARPSIAIQLFRKGFSQFMPFVVTVTAILVTDLLVGIVIGILVGLYFVLLNNFRSSISVARKEGELVIRFHPEVSFLNKAILKQNLSRIRKGSRVIIDTSRCRFIDPDIEELIEDFVLTSAAREIQVEWRRSDIRL